MGGGERPLPPAVGEGFLLYAGVHALCGTLHTYVLYQSNSGAYHLAAQAAQPSP